jgi:hypothetical protein
MQDVSKELSNDGTAYSKSEIDQLEIRRRLRWASMLELTLYTLGITVVLYRQLYIETDHFRVPISMIAWPLFLTSTEMLGVAALCFVAYFSFILNGVTPFVSIVQSKALGGRDAPNAIRSARSKSRRRTYWRLTTVSDRIYGPPHPPPSSAAVITRRHPLPS